MHQTRAKRQDNQAEPRAGTEQPPVAEWIFGGLGALFVVGALGFLLYQGLAGDNTPPKLRADVLAVEPLESSYRVQFRVRNEGGMAAAQVAVSGELMADGPIERRTATIDYVPAHSARQGGLFFDTDPRRGSLRLRAEGYAEP